MRLINANTLKGEFTGSFVDAYPTALVRTIIDLAPTIDAIPVEKVARMLALYTEDYPCSFATGHYKSQKDEFCGFNSGCSYESNYDCWLHAIREGWLDE